MEWPRNAAVTTAELYVPWQAGGAFAAANSPAITLRAWATAAALRFNADATVRSGPTDGLLLLAGGSANANASAPTTSAELYGFATVRTDQADYSPGTKVVITGSGFAAGETVAFTLAEEPYLDTHTIDSVVADASGNVFSDQFIPDEHDLGIKFYLTTTGTLSGLQAQTTFTDARKYDGAISGSNLGGGATSSYTFTVTNNSTGGELLGSSDISVPTGYSNVVLGTVTASASKTWTANLSGNTIQLRSSGNPNILNVGQSVTVTFTATNPCTTSSYTWAGGGSPTLDFTNPTSSFSPAPATTISSNCYEASISPTIGTASATSAAYSLTVTNRADKSVGGNAALLGSANITVPAGFSSVVLGAVTSLAGTWTATLSAGVIQLRANNSNARLDLNQSVSLALTATNPSSANAYVWTTAVKNATDFSGTSTFALS